MTKKYPSLQAIEKGIREIGGNPTLDIQAISSWDLLSVAIPATYYNMLRRGEFPFFKIKPELDFQEFGKKYKIHGINIFRGRIREIREKVSLNPNAKEKKLYAIELRKCDALWENRNEPLEIRLEKIGFKPSKDALSYLLGLMTAVSPKEMAEIYSFFNYCAKFVSFGDKAFRDEGKENYFSINTQPSNSSWQDRDLELLPVEDFNEHLKSHFFCPNYFIIAEKIKC